MSLSCTVSSTNGCIACIVFKTKRLVYKYLHVRILYTHNYCQEYTNTLATEHGQAETIAISTDRSCW